MLAHLRCGETYTRLACGFGIGVATVYRYITEAVHLLAAVAPHRAEAIRVAARRAFVILDGPSSRLTGCIISGRTIPANTNAVA